MTTPLPQNNSKRTRSMIITLCIFIVLGALWFSYYWFYARFYEYTDDAYVDGNKVIITPQISGIVTSFSTLDADFVGEGRVLIELDKTDAKISLAFAEAALAETVREVVRLFEQVRDYAAQIEVRKAEFIKAAQDYEHRKGLVEEGGVSVEDFEHAQAALSANFFLLRAIESQYIASVAQVENTTVETHPLIEKAKNKVRDAYIFYQRCTIKAPVSGIVAQRSVQVGQQVQVGQPLLAIVPLDQMWVTANFKEVQLSSMRIGQSAKVTSDTYGKDVVFYGIIAGIGGGTGSIFSMLPPQNATGNWIKIVQRIPVRISLDQSLVKLYPLRLGLSTEVLANISDTQKPYIPKSLPDAPLYTTPVFETQELGSEELIVKIIQDNISPTFQGNRDL